MPDEENLLEEVFGTIDPEETTEETEVAEEVLEETETTEETVETEEVTEETTEEPAEETTEEEVEKKEEEPKEETPDELVTMVKELDPDVDVKDHAEAMEFIKERLKESDEAIQMYEKNNKEIYDVFSNIPEVGDFMKAIIKGMDPQVAAAIYISETLAPEAGDESIEKYQVALAEKKAEQKKREQALEEFKENHKSSIKTAEEFVTEKKIDKKLFEAYLQDFDKQITSLKSGKITKDLLDFVLKANKYEKDVKEAEERGYLKGKNEKIVLKKNSKENTDGLPSITSGNEKERNSPKPDFWDMLSRRR